MRPRDEHHRRGGSGERRHPEPEEGPPVPVGVEAEAAGHALLGREGLRVELGEQESAPVVVAAGRALRQVIAQPMLGGWRNRPLEVRVDERAHRAGGHGVARRRNRSSNARMRISW